MGSHRQAPRFKRSQTPGDIQGQRATNILTYLYSGNELRQYEIWQGVWSGVGREMNPVQQSEIECTNY